MPVNQFLDEPNDDSSDGQTDAAEPSSVISLEPTKTRFDPTALVAASGQQLSVIGNQLRVRLIMYPGRIVLWRVCARAT
jgi:hypothetical protein